MDYDLGMQLTANERRRIKIQMFEAAGGSTAVLMAKRDDGDPNTAWKTSSYQDNFPKFKQGVGVFVDLGRNQKVRGVSVNATPGYTAEIFVADRPGTDLAGWGKTRSAGGTSTFDLGGVTGRYVLVWFTSLPQLEGGYRAEVSEIAIDAA